MPDTTTAPFFIASFEISWCKEEIRLGQDEGTYVAFVVWIIIFISMIQFLGSNITVSYSRFSIIVAKAFTEASLKMKLREPSNTREQESSPWPTVGLTQMDHNFSLR